MVLRRSFGELLFCEYRFNEVIDAAGELDPRFCHQPEALASGVGQGVVLAGVSGVGFDPLGGEHSLGLEAVQDGIDRALKAAVPKAGERRHLQSAFAELGLPAIGPFADGESLCGGVGWVWLDYCTCHALYLALLCIVL
jgi:hypothetical protein